jgi:gamma-glutamylcyclotransferase (GGCT)/AIG2-like uncharacterized protein YtfP
VIEPFIASSRPARLPNAGLYFVDPYPMVVDGDGTVIGELIALPADHYDRALAVLDKFEGYDPGTDSGDYRRRLRQVEDLISGERVEAWVYLGERGLAEKCPRVLGDDWSRRDLDQL